MVRKISRGKIHIVEKNLEKLVQKALSKKLFTVSNFPVESDIFIITVPTPFTKHKSSSIPLPKLDYINSAIKAIANVLKKNDFERIYI